VEITIADNASQDATPEIAATLASSIEHVSLLRLEQKGRGVAIGTRLAHPRGGCGLGR
jgi:glycosyltransferase involved in cell wall biosynthesis